MTTTQRIAFKSKWSKLLIFSLYMTGMSACSTVDTVNNALSVKKKTVEYYRIFDIQTQADRNSVIDSASKGLGANTNTVNESRPIPSFSKPPAEAGRFKVINPLAGSKLGAFAQMAGASNLALKTATCDDAIWIARADRTISGRSKLRLTVCLFQYKDGYHIDMYGIFNREQGGLMEISRAMTTAMVGTPEQWTEKTMINVVRQIRKDTGATVKLLEAQPAVGGTPWLDEGSL